MSQSSSKKRKINLSALRKYPFQADFCDHFETPRCAYEHILPLLDLICKKAKTDRQRLQIYDPYFCDGRVKEHLKSFGFMSVFNECEDFYKTAERGETPSYDVLVTNPPYSEDHKARCLKFCVESHLPWIILMPCYVASKQYYVSSGASAFFVLPHDTYQYTHPTGAGHDQSHFKSMWYVGNTSEPACNLLPAVQSHPVYSAGPARIVLRLDQLQADGVVAARRLNPKRRRREMLKAKQLE